MTNNPVVIKGVAQVTCPAAFQSRSRKIQYRPSPKAINEKLKISSSLPKVKMAMRLPPRITPVNQSRERVESLRRKRDPMISVETRLMANQIAERYKARTSISFRKDKTGSEEASSWG